MQRIVDEVIRRGRLATQFVAGAIVIALVSACGTDRATPTAPELVSEQPVPPVLDLQPQGLSAAFSTYLFLPFTLDVGGPNDYSGQQDVNQLSRADNDGKFGVAWTWDEVDAWTGTGQTGDVCALFDTDASGGGLGNVDYAVCVRVNNPGGNPTTVAQLPFPESPLLYECGDKKSDRCTTTVIPRSLGGTFCEVYKTSTDAFPGVGADGADAMAACGIDLAAIGTPSAVKLLNICSFPSGSPNSNPFDCIFIPGSGYLKIVKKSTPDNSGAIFNFSLKEGTTEVGTPSLTDNQVGDAVSALIALDPSKTYSLEEINFPSGWSLGAASCTGSSTTVTKDGNKLTGIKTTEGGTVTCTFENAQSGSITIVKDANPNDQQDFVFSGNITGCTSFTLDDDAGATGADDTNSNQKVCAVGSGTYNVDETVPGGWVKTSATCSDGSPITAIALSAGENVTCSFTNTKNGSVKIVKDAIPNDQQDFVFTGTITGCTSFTLDDDAGATGANGTFLNEKVCAVAPGTYSVDETVPAEWTKTSATCSDGSPITAVDVAAGESITCTFTNTKGGSITIVKNADPNDQQDFAFTGTITGCTSFTLDDDAGASGANDTYSHQKVCPVTAGTYNVDETVPANWVKTSATCSDGSPITAIEVAAGESVTCTFTNTKNGSITIVKDANPNDQQDFVFSGTITNCTSFTLDDDAGASGANGTYSNERVCAVAPGTYNVDETVPADWVKTSATCSDGSPITAIAVAAGESITCTFTNTKNGSITIVKDANPNDQQDFAFTGNITNCASFTLDDDAGASGANGTYSHEKVCDVAPGTYNVDETVPPEWTKTSATCSDGSPITAIQVSAGENITCTFVNTKGGSITIVKDATPNDQQDFAFTGTITGCTSFTLDDDAGATGANGTYSNEKVCAVAPGTYSVDETVPGGWAKTSATCSDGSPVTAIAVAAGESITCTFTNTKHGSITIVKNAVPDNAQDFAYTTSGAGVSSFTLDDDGAGGSATLNTTTFGSLLPGSRTVTESAVTGWTITNIDCTGNASSTVTIGATGGFNAGDNAVTIDLAAGDNVSCTFTNTVVAPGVTVVKTASPTSIPETGGNVTYTVEVTNTASVSVQLTTLSDNKFPNISGAGECSVPQTIAAGGTYTCSFTRAVPAGEAGGTYVNTITATVTNAGGSANDDDDATVTYTNVNPSISVTKTANPTSLNTVQTGVLTFTADPGRTYTSNTTPTSGTPNYVSPTCDDGGANDINSAQVDLNCFNRADNVSGKIHVKWSWDDIDEWSGSGATGDACSLLDTDNDGNANVAICARIQNDAQGNVVQIGGAGAVDVYICSDSKTDRCGKPVSQVPNSGEGTTACTIGIVPDGFEGVGSDHSTDVEATCVIDRAMSGAPIPAGADLLNVCSFPSGEPNSNPFDCVVQAGAGFIQIIKVASPTTTQQFGFTLSPAATDGSNEFIVAGGVTSAAIPAAPGTTYSLTETLPTNWAISTASCTVDGQSTGTFSLTNKRVTGITIRTGQTTICTFTNTGLISGNVEYTIRVTNLGKENVSLFSLADDKFGDLNGVGTCTTGGTILGSAAGNLFYECKFTKTLSGAAGTSHTNEVTAVAKDNENPQNADTKKASATVSFVSPP